MGGIFELCPELFPELRHFGIDDRDTIGLIWIVAIIILMVAFCCIKRGKGTDLSNDRVGPEPRRIRVTFGLFRNGSLLLTMVQNY